ncbi:MAG: hypothetical protein ACXVA9_12255 [Bdellovibrionales bacterium]
MIVFKFSLAFSILISLLACDQAKSPIADSGQNATFAIYPDRIKARAELDHASDESFGHPSTQILHFVVCLQNLVSGQNIVPGTPFSIADGTGSDAIKVTDANGCVHWDETHKYSYFSPQRNVSARREIRGLGNHRGTVTLLFNVKPWLEGEEAVQSGLNQETYSNPLTAPGGLGFYSAYPKDPTARLKPHLDISENSIEFHYVEIGKDAEFSIDPYLNLSIPFRFTFSFQPMITHQIFSGTSSSEALTSGKLRVTFVFFASSKGDPSQDTRYLTSAQMEGVVGANGRLSGSLLLKYPHMLFASGRQSVLMNISPADENSEIQPQSFAGSFSYIEQQATITMLTDGRNGETLHQENQSARFKLQSERPLPLADFLKNHDLLVNQVTDFPARQLVAAANSTWSTTPSLSLSKEELLSALLRDGPDRRGLKNNLRSSLSVQARLCRAYLAMSPGFGLGHPIRSFQEDYLAAMQDNGDFSGSAFCNEDDPKKYVNIEQFDFVEQLASTTPRNVKMYSFTNQEFGIYYAKEHTQGLIKGFAMQIPGFAMFGGLVDVSQTNFDTHSLIERGSFGQTQWMAIDVGTLEVYAKVKSCVLISSLRKPFVQKPWLICEPGNQPAKWIPEQFFFYSQIFSSIHSPFIDPFSAQSGVKVFIRGKDHMQKIIHTLQGADFQKTGFNVFIQTHAPDLSKIETLENLDSLTDQAVPGAFGRD